MGLLERIDEDYEEWIGEELPEVLGLIGPAAVPRLGECLTIPHDGMWAQITAALALREIGNRHPVARDECISALSKGLESFTSQDPGLNGFLISSLVDLKAVEAAPLMEKAFAADCVDLLILGDWEDVQISLGLLDKRQTPARRAIAVPEPLPPEPRQPTRTVPGQEWKDERKSERRRRDDRKAKRKRQKQARRKQRKRK
jgi:hypothetical protein